MKKWTHRFIIGTFVSLYAVVSIISTIHVIDFFMLSNPVWLAVSLAIAFEIGAAASLSSIIVMEKMNKSLIWFLFILLTAMQMMGNAYYAYMHLENFQGWIELFGLVDYEPIVQKRFLSIISGAILPLVALGFIKSLVDYIKPSDETVSTNSPDDTKPGPQDGITDPTVEEMTDKPFSQHTYSEDDKRRVLEFATEELSNSHLSKDINNITKELTEDDIKKYNEASKTSSAQGFHPQIFNR